MLTARWTFASHAILAAVCAFALLAQPACNRPKKDDEESSEPEPTAKSKKAPAATATAAARTFEPKVHADGNAAYVWIDKIVLTSESTTLSMRITNNTKTKLDGLRTAPPKDPDAFYITRKADKKRFDLRSVSGDLPMKPGEITLQPDQAVTFTLVFDPLDKGMTEFDLIEGANQDPKSTYWNFKGVKLQ
jgi:hypothetical protein